MRVQILMEALEDLDRGFQFYEDQEAGLGSYFLGQLRADIEALLNSSGIHPLVFSYHRSLSRRFPFAIYYRVEGERVLVHAVLDCRQNPVWIGKRLQEGN